VGNKWLQPRSRYSYIELIGCSIASKPKYVSLNSISRSASHKAIEYPATSMLLMGLVNIDSFVVAGVTNTYGSGEYWILKPNLTCSFRKW
jgi:hypothetical protein